MLSQIMLMSYYTVWLSFLYSASYDQASYSHRHWSLQTRLTVHALFTMSIDCSLVLAKDVETHCVFPNPAFSSMSLEYTVTICWGNQRNTRHCDLFMSSFLPFLKNGGSWNCSPETCCASKIYQCISITP